MRSTEPMFKSFVQTDEREPDLAGWLASLGNVNTEISRIFDKVFPHGDFTQHPAEIRRIEEDGELFIDFRARFTPK